jgi:uncharacterized OB-fold protein
MSDYQLCTICGHRVRSKRVVCGKCKTRVFGEVDWPEIPTLLALAIPVQQEHRFSMEIASNVIQGTYSLGEGKRRHKIGVSRRCREMRFIERYWEHAAEDGGRSTDIYARRNRRWGSFRSRG